MRPACRLAQEVNITRVGADALKNALLYTDKAASLTPIVERGSKDALLPLQDWPITVKDNFCTLDMPTACSSRMLLDYKSPIEATSVKLLREAGASIIAKTNCDEFGMGSANIYSIHGPVMNPHSESQTIRVAGGSSGGAAAGVACGTSKIALASDTGGSIRIPAAYCGVYGLKPSYGLISRWGLVAYADSLDTVGLLGSKVSDIKIAFQVISQFDQRDSTSISTIHRKRAKDAAETCLKSIWQGDGSLSGLRVGVPRQAFPLEVNQEVLPAVRQVLSDMKSRGAEIISVNLPSIQFALSAYYVLASAEASSNLARYDGIRYGYRASSSKSADALRLPSNITPFHRQISQTRSEAFGQEVKKRILLGTYSLTSDFFDNYFLQAQKVRKLIREEFDGVFRISSALTSKTISSDRSKGIDILVSPSTVGIAPTIEEAENMGIKAYTQDLLTVPASLAGIPAMSVPVDTASGMPVGVTLMTQWGCEEILFEVAKSLTPFNHLQYCNSMH